MLTKLENVRIEMGASSYAAKCSDPGRQDVKHAVIEPALVSSSAEEQAAN